MKTKLLTILMACILYLTPTISSSDTLSKYCHVHWDGLNWKKGKKYFGKWEKFEVSYHGSKVAILYIPSPVYKHLNCNEQSLDNEFTECGNFFKSGYKFMKENCKNSVY